MTKKLLIVDDDPVFRLITKRLVSHSFPEKEIMQFENGKEACEFLRSSKNKIKRAQILLDINMPVMNGWEFLDACSIEADKSDLHIYIVTSSVDESDKKKAENYPIVKGFVEKPLSKDFIQSLK